MAGSTANFGFAYPKSTDRLRAGTLATCARDIDTACHGLAATGSCVFMKNEGGTIDFSRSNTFLGQYPSSGVVSSTYTEAGTTITYNRSTGLVYVPAGYVVMCWGVVTTFSASGNVTLAVGIGGATSAYANAPTTDFGGALAQCTADVGSSQSAVCPPVIIKSTGTYVGLYARCAAQPPINAYRFGVITLATGAALM